MPTTTPAERRRRRAAVGVCAAVLLLLAGCSSSSPSPGAVGSGSRAGTAVTCHWGAAAFSAPARAVMFDEDGSYLLVDVRTGRILDRCSPSDPEWAYPPLGLQLPSQAGVRSTTDQDGTWWWGALRPGGSDGHTVVAPDGVIDLDSGRRIRITIAGHVPAGVGRSSVIMMRAGSTTDGIPSVDAADWCVAPLADPKACAPIPGASGVGTPAVAPDGSVIWLTNELTRSAARIAGTKNRYFYVRTAHGVVTAEGGLYPKPTDPPFVLPDRISPDGRAFLVIASTTAGGRPETSPLAGTAPITWYTVGTDGAQTAHRAEASWRDVGSAIGAAPNDLARGDIAVSPDGATLYAVVTDPTAGSRVRIVSVAAGGRPVVLGRAADNGDDHRYIDGTSHFLTVPTTAP